MSEVKNIQVSMLEDLRKVQRDLGPVLKDSKNPFFKSNYADLNSHIDLLRPLLEANNFVLDQSTTVMQGVNLVISRISHVPTGATKESVLALPQLEDMQKLGSAITYARRYTLSALFAMTTTDDDGNTASNKAAPSVSKQPVKSVKSSSAF